LDEARETRSTTKGRGTKMNDVKIIELNQDEKAVALKATSDIFFAAQELYKRIKEDNLDEEMKETMMNLLEHYVVKAAEPLKFDSRSAEKIEANHRDIRAANVRIHELEKQLGDKNPIVGLVNLLDSLRWTVYHWWNYCGFALVSEETFGCYGFKGEFILMTSHVRSMSKSPVTDKEKAKNKIEEMIDSGLEMEKEEGGDWAVLDTDGNKKIISEAIKKTFPSAKICKWETVYMYNSEKHRLRQCEVYIKNLEEIKAVEEWLKKENIGEE
jgi:sRNA-binding carbon storage regulator CsrA